MYNNLHSMELFIDKIYAEPGSLKWPIAQRLKAIFPQEKWEVVAPEQAKHTLSEVSLTRGKRILYLTESKGGLVKPCPGTSAPYICCRYMILNPQVQCPMDCTYCILQDYLDFPVLTLHVNLDLVFQELNTLLEKYPSRIFRFGTGELADSLALDSLVPLSIELIYYFSHCHNAILELKTKTDCIENVLKSPFRQAVISWSLNPQSVIETEEYLTASLEARLRSAEQCAKAGFLIGFHFDPILAIPNFEKAYTDLVNQIFDRILPSRIAWISLGTLRFPPSAKSVVEVRFPKTRILYEEMIRGLDNKMRYIKPLRLELYKTVYQAIRKRSTDVFVYFCMESSDIWEKVMGKSPMSNAELDFWFAEHLYFHFPELGFPQPKREDYQKAFSEL